MKKLSEIKAFKVFSLVLLLWFLRMVLPGMKYVFIPSFVLIFSYFLLKFRPVYSQKSLVFEFLKTFTPLFILVVFYLFGVLTSFKLYARNMSDLLEVAIAISFLFIYFTLIHSTKSHDTFKTIFNIMVNQIAIASVLVAVIGFTKYILQVYNVPVPLETPPGTSINSDTNFYALFSFLGIFGLGRFFLRPLRYYQLVGIQLVVLFLMGNILFSFSYRANIFLMVLLLAAFVFQGFGFFSSKWQDLHLFSKNTRLLLVFVFVSFFIFKNSNVKQLPLFSPLNENIKALEEKPYDVIMNAFHFERWNFAWSEFHKQSICDKVFGNGFEYLERFGSHFYNDSSHYDYPHNPVLSALLYSGIIGALFALLFLIISVYYSLIYLKKYPLFSMMLMVSLLFVFFSGNSLFSVPVFLFLFSLSFLVRHQEITDLHIDFNLHKPGSKLLKEVTDYLGASLVFLALMPVLVTIGFIVLLFMGWPFIYSQTRVGQNGKNFRLYKFRTMKNNKPGSPVAAEESERISVVGKILRKTKLDELPELWNIMRGDMSFVGPRPDVPGYADKLTGNDRNILHLKPGLTGPASLKYINEDNLLLQQKDPRKFNDEVIFPDKVRINLAYMKYWTFWLDIKIIIFTALRKPLKENYF